MLSYGPPHPEALDAAAAADVLGPDDIHVWSLAHAKHDGRKPLLRLLAGYLHCPAEQVQLHHGEHGKPMLDATCGLHFNWSHSGDQALIAVARDLPLLGVDVECRERRTLDVLALAKRFFAPAEYASLANLSPEMQMHAFRHLWSLKEAVLKAHGRGMGYGLERIQFHAVARRWVPESFSGSIPAASAWQLFDWAVPGGHACVAWCGPARKMHFFRA